MNIVLKSKPHISKDKLKKIDIPVFRRHISDYWIILTVIKKSLFFCNCCNQYVNRHHVIFVGNRNEKRSICVKCLRNINYTLYSSIRDFIVYSESLLLSNDMYRTPPHSVRQLIIYNLLAI